MLLIRTLFRSRPLSAGARRAPRFRRDPGARAWRRKQQRALCPTHQLRAVKGRPVALSSRRRTLRACFARSHCRLYCLQNGSWWELDAYPLPCRVHAGRNRGPDYRYRSEVDRLSGQASCESTPQWESKTGVRILNCRLFLVLFYPKWVI
jgi:hypothetical protein